jgi:hypothetical protein
MCGNQERRPKGLSLPDLSTSGTSSKLAETPCNPSKNSSQTRDERKHADEENGKSGHVFNVSKGETKFRRATDMSEELDAAQEQLQIAVEETASGFELLGKVSVAKYKTRNAAGDIRESVCATELQEAALRHEMACKEAFAFARNVARLIGSYASVGSEDKPMYAEVTEELNTLTSCLETAVRDLQTTKEKLQVALDQHKLNNGNTDQIEDKNEITFQVI